MTGSDYGLCMTFLFSIHSITISYPKAKNADACMHHTFSHPIVVYRPQALRATCDAVASIRPRATAWPLVRSFMAAWARLKPVAVWSTASTLMDRPL